MIREQEEGRKSMKSNWSIEKLSRKENRRKQTHEKGSAAAFDVA